MNDPMTILKADHREVKRMLTTLADSEEGKERDEMCAELNTALTLHMDIEERILYPVIAREIGAEDEEEASIEHGLARNGLATMVNMVDKPGFGAAVEMLKGGITHHVEEEETELLPELKTKLERADWLALGDAIAEAKASAGAPASPPSRRRSGKRRAAAKR
jgi:hemerythrin-like domain-containing protein